ncbi:CoA transferase [Sneathiella sp. P13V-1]|uniref:CaiB/BaiF CoA transferase family protein n=1 Tax=Sneathiella sp. P13V-1 TaxID=2697366 RepID=UPI00187BA1B5|nr:CoA transferase [Sneathiella sp. P13V-1]MBE7638381.1 CoA transferase [Sneathiella sp. P13V-1]
MPGTLEGIRIIDLSTVVLGPWASQMLGDLGADVIKVETPSGDTTRKIGPYKTEGMASFFMGCNRNKRSVVLDLTKEDGREAFYDLVKTVDVIIHNMRPRIAKKLGLEYETISKVNPDIVFCATYGFRSGGPLENNPAYDDIIQAAAGITDLQTVTSDQPRFVPTIVADKTSSFNVLYAVLAALFHRERHGTGQAIEVPMFECLVDYVMVEHLNGAVFEPAIDTLGYKRLLNSQRRPYATTDGYLAVLPYTDKNWQDFFDVAGRPELKTDPRFESLASRTKHSDEVYGILGEIVATRSTAEWLDVLSDANIPVQTSNKIDDLLENEQLLATGFWRTFEHPSEGTIRMAEPPIKFSKTPSTIRLLQPRLGEHSREVLKEAGFTDARIDGLIKSGAAKEAELEEA